MGILERTRHVIRADLNDLLDRAKDPEAVLDGYLDDLETVLAEAESLRGAEAAERGLYESKLRDLKAAQKTWIGKARACLQKGDEDLARTALEKKLDLQEEAAEVSRELAQRESSLAALDEGLDGLRARIGEVRQRRRELHFKRQMLQARTELQETIRKVGPTEEAAAVEQAKNQLANLESRLEAHESAQAESFDERIVQMEAAERKNQRAQAVENELQLLRRPGGGKKKS